MKLSPLLLLVFSVQVFAAESSEKIAKVDPVSSGYLIKLSIGLVIVLGLIFGLSWLLKKMQLTQHTNNGAIQIISAISVGHRDRLALVQIGEEQILVGLTPGRIKKLHSLKKPVDLTNDAQINDSLFADKFQQMLKRNKSNVEESN